MTGRVARRRRTDARSFSSAGAASGEDMKVRRCTHRDGAVVPEAAIRWCAGLLVLAAYAAAAAAERGAGGSGGECGEEPPQTEQQAGEGGVSSAHRRSVPTAAAKQCARRAGLIDPWARSGEPLTREPTRPYPIDANTK